jgi:hypothetical protein
MLQRPVRSGTRAALLRHFAAEGNPVRGLWAKRRYLVVEQAIVPDVAQIAQRGAKTQL